MKSGLGIATLVLIWLTMPHAAAGEAPLSEASQECMECHEVIHGGIAADWQRSRHAALTPQQAMAADTLARKVSSTEVPAELREVAVGCAECHTLRPDEHTDSFEHNGYTVHTVVSPRDCAVCHAQEEQQYGQNIMSNAYGNLMGNPLYAQMRTAVAGTPVFKDGGIVQQAPSDVVMADSCLYCHGTRLEVSGLAVRDSDLGEMEFPVIKGWPNQGVGRINPDGSLGACTPCHSRHVFSIAMARKPETCKQCHVGPDVPAHKIYAASKHGNIYSASKQDWAFDAVPWTVGQDFSAPTCAACHMSLLADGDGEVIVPRSHQMSDRLPWRIYGLIYAHPHPLQPDTTIITNKDKQPLPTDFEGGFATPYLIDAAEQERRKKTMQAVCTQCHADSWTQGHWEKFESTIKETNAATLSATRVMQALWQKGKARGLAQGQNPFDETLERIWSDTWLFHANSIRFASAMAGGGDYGVFADGRYQMMQKITRLNDRLNP